MNSPQPAPPAPEDWNLTIGDLMREMEEGKRKSIEPFEIDWAREYERKCLPPDTRFPKKGDVYEAIEDLDVDYLTSWAAPFTGGGSCRLKRGERIEIPEDPNGDRPIAVYGTAVRYEELEREIIPAEDRNAPKYSGYYFSLKTADLNSKFLLVDEIKS